LVEKGFMVSLTLLGFEFSIGMAVSNSNSAL